MRKVFAHRIWFIMLSIVFGAGIILYFGTGPAGRSGMGGGADSSRASRAAQPILTVNGEPVPRSQYDQVWDNMKRRIGGNEPQPLHKGRSGDQAVERVFVVQRHGGEQRRVACFDGPKTDGVRG